MLMQTWLSNNTRFPVHLLLEFLYSPLLTEMPGERRLRDMVLWRLFDLRGDIGT